MFVLSPRSGDYSGASLGVRSVALLHPIYRLRPDYSDTVGDDVTRNRMQRYKKNPKYANI